MTLTIQQTTDLASDTYKDSLDIRMTVFVKEQQVSIEEEVLDEEPCTHFIVYQQKTAIATARLFPKTDKRAYVQRVAVLKDYRGQHIGQQLITHMETAAKEMGFSELKLGAQTHALGFYEQLGYKAFGEEYLDAGIWHYDMLKTI